MILEEDKTYYLHENVTGEEDLGCRFRFRLFKDAAEFFFDVKDDALVSPFTADNEDIWQGDAVEVFLSPNGDKKHYYELEVSPFCVRFWGRISNPDGKTPRLKKLPPPFFAEASRTEEGYAVHIRLPLSALKKFDRSRFCMNAFRIDAAEDGTQKLYALHPTRCGSFHRPAYFIGQKEERS